MKRSATRLASLFLCAVFTVTLLSHVAPAFAVETSGACGDGLFWKYDKYVLTVYGSGDMYDFTKKSSQNNPTEPPWRSVYNSISRVVISDGCTSIGDNAFYNSQLSEVYFEGNSLCKIGKGSFELCRNLIKVDIPDSVSVIGDEAFSGCTSLVSANFNSSDASVPRGAFSGDTALEKVDLSKNCRSIGAYAFNDCKRLSSIDLSNVGEICSLSFQSCALSSVVFGENLTRLETNAFYGCKSLSDVAFDENADPVSFSNLALGETPYYEALPDGLYTLFHGKVLMHKGTFSGTELTVPDGVKLVSDFAFDNAVSLCEVTFPDSVTTIGDFAFRNCEKLVSVFVPPTVTSIGFCALGKESTGLEYINFENFIIRGHGESAASAYAVEEGFPYECVHEFEDIYDVSSCERGGFRRLVCSFCGACTEREKLFPLKHVWSETAFPASCDADGFTKRVCKVCGKEEITNVTPAAGHTPYGGWIIVAEPSCAGRGRVAKLCAVCGKEALTVWLERSAHTPDDKFTAVAEATCESAGLEAVLCTVCGEAVEKRKTPPLGHTPAPTPVILTAASEDGKVAGCEATVCERCGAYIKITWIGGDAVSSTRAMIGAMRGELDPECASVDFNGDGAFNEKDILTARRLSELQGGCT